MKEDKSVDRIVEYYDNRVSEYGISGKATLFDENLRLLEIDTVKPWLNPDDTALEVFCGNGVSTMEFAKSCRSVLGIDLSEKMIQTARQLLHLASPSMTNVSFERANVLDIADLYPRGRFSTIISVRGLINLPSWQLQKEAISRIHELLPPRGKFIFVEGAREGLYAINEFRKEHRLSPLQEPWYDNYFETSKLNPFMAQYFDEHASRDLSAYFLISRILYPAACLPEDPSFDHVCNAVARMVVPYVRTDTNTTLLTCRCFTKR